MKEIILLPGNSKSNRDWILEVREKLKSFFDKSSIFEYAHWETGNEIIDMDYETERLSKYLGDKKDYVIFAKSAGVALALKCIAEKKISPLGCMFLGTPVNWCRKNDIQLEINLENFDVPTIFIQKRNDPAFSSEDLKSLLINKNVKNYKLLEIPGEDHHYENLDQIEKLMSELVK
jgi:predicted alpha/beta hydrolase family esterase